jgi:hypothetical protein
MVAEQAMRDDGIVPVICPTCQIVFCGLDIHAGDPFLYNQTVMSAGLCQEFQEKSAILDQDHSRLCAFVHGFSAG